MISVKPRKMMNVDRMRRQREKHHHIRYRVQYMDRDDVLDVGPEVMEFIIEEFQEVFRMEVARWNMWRKHPLTTTTVQEFDIDFNRVKIIFEARVITKARRWMDVMDRMVNDGVLTRNQARLAFGLEPM